MVLSMKALIVLAVLTVICAVTISNGAFIAILMIIVSIPMAIVWLLCAFYAGIGMAKLKENKGWLMLLATQVACVVGCVLVELIINPRLESCFNTCTKLDMTGLVGIYIIATIVTFLPAYGSLFYHQKKIRGMLFPTFATEEERNTIWSKIAEITDHDLGFDTPRGDTATKVRFCVRVFLRNAEGQVCIVRSEKYGYSQFPGGGIEEGESIEAALRREAAEEAGFLIKDIEPIGYTVEKREDMCNNHDWNLVISYVFKAAPDEAVGTNYTEIESAEGFMPVWVKLDDYITENERWGNTIEKYSGRFAARRDLEIAKYFKNVKREE